MPDRDDVLGREAQGIAAQLGAHVRADRLREVGPRGERVRDPKNVALAQPQLLSAHALEGDRSEGRW